MPNFIPYIRQHESNYMKNLRIILNEVTSPFSIESPLSSGGASDDPNTRHIQVGEPLSNSWYDNEEAITQWMNSNYAEALQWWITNYPNIFGEKTNQDIQLWITLWNMVTMYWNHPGPFYLFAGNEPQYHRDLVALRNGLLGYLEIIGVPIPKDFEN